ncbi:MAG: hypothetical protein WAW96_17855 [Alphaproteobacteria bacterium]
MRTSIIVHVARSLVAAGVAVVTNMFVPVFAHGPQLGGTKVLEITQRIIDYLPSSSIYRIGVAAYVAVLCFFGYRAARHLTMLGTILWAALLGLYIGALLLPNLQFLPLNAWAHAEAAQFIQVSPDIDLVITVVMLILALITVPVTAAFILAQIPFLRARDDEADSGPSRIEPEL